MKHVKPAAILLALVLLFTAVPAATAAESADRTMQIHMDQGDWAADLEVNHVLNYELIDNSDSVAEYYNPTEADGIYSMEFRTIHMISVNSESAVKFLDFAYNNTDEKQVTVYSFENPKVVDKTTIQYSGMYVDSLRPGWSYYLGGNMFLVEDGIYLLYNKATDAAKAEAYIISVTEAIPNDTPVLERDPIFTNPSGGALDNTIGIEPSPEYYGEVKTNGGMSFTIPNADFSFSTPAGDEVGTYSLFITEDGTLDLHFWAQHTLPDEEFVSAYDVVAYEYEPVWNGADVTFGITNIKHFIEAPYTYGAKVSGFFLSSLSLAEKDGAYSSYHYLTGIVLSTAQVEEYRKTGKIAAYPSFDWSVLGPVNPKTNTTIFWVIIGAVILLAAAAVTMFVRKKKNA